MKFSSSILFLGCCLVGLWWIVTGKVYEIPTIHVEPSSVVPFGGKLYIICGVKNVHNIKYHMYKQVKGKWKELPVTKYRNGTAVYFDQYAESPDGGSFKCKYCSCKNRTEVCSYESDEIDVIIRVSYLLKPLISATEMPFVNNKASIDCTGTNNNLNVTLHRFGKPILMTETGNHTAKASFSFSPLKVEDGGIYTCEYRNQNNRYLLSQLSDHLELNLTDSSLQKLKIKLKPEEYIALGWSAIIECWGAENGLNISLQQPRNSTSLWLSEPTGNTTKFFLAQTRLEDAGNYTCRYQHRDNPFVWSEPSESVELFVRALPVEVFSVRLVLSILILMATLLIAAEAIYSSKKEVASTSPPE